MISKEYIENFLQHRDYLINILLNEKITDLKCLNSICDHAKVCKSGSKIILDKNNSIVNLKELKKGETVDACIFSTILATFINDIQFFKNLKQNIIDEEVVNEFNKGQEEYEKKCKKK
jgi:hypothetical protein